MPKRPKIPITPFSEREQRILKIMGFILWILLFPAFIFPDIFALFLIFLGIYQFTILRKNIFHAFKEWKQGIKFLPIALLINLISITSLKILNNPILNTNISLFMVPSSAVNTFTLIDYIVAFVLIIFLCSSFNYLEEYYFRTKWDLVGIWVALHLVLGLSAWTIGQVFFILVPLGILFKKVFDKYGVETSYCLHLFNNLSVVLLQFLSFL